MKLSVVIPCFNERQTIREVIRRVQETPFEKEIIVVDDASTDGTADLVASLAQPNLVLIRQPSNQGKGAALRTGFCRASGDVVLIQDADFEYDPVDYPRLLEPILHGQADVVYGTRFQGSPRRVHLYWHDLGNKALTTLSNLTTGLNLTDMETGYKVFRREVLRGITIQSDRFGFEPEITAKLARRRFRIYEVPISYSGRSYAEGKKITWKDGVQALGQIAKYGLISDLDQGHETLERMDALEHYGRWLWSLIDKEVGQEVLELGSGTGALTRYLTSRRKVVATDVNPDYLRLLRARYDRWEGVEVCELDLDAASWPAVTGRQFDTVASSNVLEHVSDDLQVLRNSFEALRPGGKLVAIVPADPSLYGEIDRALSHVRRYSLEEAAKKLALAGFEVHRCQPFNRFGRLGWYLNGRLLRRRTVPGIQARLFDLLVPLQTATERLLPPRNGLSLVMVGVKPK